MTPMPTTTPANAMRRSRGLWCRRRTQLGDTVREHDEGGEQPGHDRLGDVDVELLVQVRGRQAEHPADDHEAGGAGRRRPSRTPGGSRRGRGRHGGRGHAAGRVSDRVSGMRSRAAARTEATTMSTTYGETVGHGVAEASRPLTRGPRVSPAAAATDAANAASAHVLRGMELADGGGHAGHHHSAADAVDHLAGERARPRPGPEEGHRADHGQRDPGHQQRTAADPVGDRSRAAATSGPGSPRRRRTAA